jgi:hypothetical protein
LFANIEAALQTGEGNESYGASGMDRRHLKSLAPGRTALSFGG